MVSFQFSFGWVHLMLYHYFLTHFDGAIYLTLVFVTAPISGAISRKAGIRLSMALGGALAFAGFCATSFVYRASLLFLTVTAMIGK